MPTPVRTSLRVVQIRPIPPENQLSDDAQRAMLRRAGVPVSFSDTELRVFTRRRSVFPWRQIRFGTAFVGFLVLLWFDVYGFMALCDRMGWFGGAR